MEGDRVTLTGVKCSLPYCGEITMFTDESWPKSEGWVKAGDYWLCSRHKGHAREAERQTERERMADQQRGIDEADREIREGAE